MIALLLRLFALRPLLSMAIFGIPVLALIAIGVVTIFALKVLIFIVLPILLIWWLVKRARRSTAPLDS